MSFAELYDACWQAVSTRLDRISGQSIAVPPRLPVGNATAGARTADRFAVLDWLDAALELAGRHPLHELAHGLTALSEDLIWTQNAGYSAANTTASFLDGYAYAPIAGPGAPVPVSVPICGFVLMAPGVVYADHQHAPAEIYLVMTPGAQWRLDGAGWFDVRPGDLIRHNPWQLHATRTTDQPFLAFAGWLEAGQRDAIRFGS